MTEPTTSQLLRMASVMAMDPRNRDLLLKAADRIEELETANANLRIGLAESLRLNQPEPNDLIAAALQWRLARYAYLRPAKPTQELQIDLLTAECRLNDAVLALDTKPVPTPPQTDPNAITPIAPRLKGYPWDISAQPGPEGSS